MKAYSLDLREKIVETYQAGGITQRELAARFRVSLFFVVKLLRLCRTGQRLPAKPRGGQRKPLLTMQMRQFIRAELARENDLTLLELIQSVKQQFKVPVSNSTMCRALAAMNLRRKKRRFSQAND